MTILLVSGPDITSEYPVPTFIHDQAVALRSLGCRVFVLVPVAYGKRGTNTRPYTLQYYEIDGIQYRFFRFLSFSNYGNYWFNHKSCCFFSHSAVHSIVKNIKPDIIVGHMFNLFGSLAVRLKEKLGIPAVIVTHGGDTFEPIKQGKADFIFSLARRADTVIAVSDMLKKTLLSQEPRLPVHVIYNGFSFSKMPGLISGKMPLSILYAGQFINRKNADILIRAFADIRKDFPYATLTLVGGGPNQADLQLLCNELSVESAVAFPGQIPNEQVLRYMSQAQLFCMPSVEEGFGIVYIEAMASGCVTIGTKGEGIDGFIVDGENGLLVSPDVEDVSHAIRRCFQSPEWADRLRKRGIETAMTLTWENNAHKHLKLYQAIAGATLKRG